MSPKKFKMNLLFRRRSVRKYTSQTIGPEKLQLLIEAAVMAPSAGNQQPWQFILVTDRTRLNELASVTTNAGMLRKATAAVVVVADLVRVFKPDMWVQDCSAATQNILLQATELELGSVWIGVFPREDRMEKTASLLGIPSPHLPFSIIALGYPAEFPPTPQRFTPDLIHLNHW